MLATQMMCPIHEVQVAVTGVSNACVKGAVEIIIMVAPPSLPPYNHVSALATPR